MASLMVKEGVKEVSCGKLCLATRTKSHNVLHAKTSRKVINKTNMKADEVLDRSITKASEKEKVTKTTSGFIVEAAICSVISYGIVYGVDFMFKYPTRKVIVICLKQGDAKELAFPIEIGINKLVGELKDAINASQSFATTANTLILWRVNCSFDAFSNDTMLQAMENPNNRLDDPTKNIGKAIGAPAGGTIHVIVENPTQ